MAASAHIIATVIGLGFLSLAWFTAQLGWIAGPTVLFLFSFITYYTSTLLASCYSSGDPITGKRNYTYMDAVRAYLGGVQVKLCRAVQYLNLLGILIGYTIVSCISMMGIERSNYFHTKGHDRPCHVSSNSYAYMIAFGVVQIFLSQIPDFDQISWLSNVAAVMSFTYYAIGLGLAISKVAENGRIKGSFKRVSIGVVTEMQKVWRSFQALGAIHYQKRRIYQWNCRRNFSGWRYRRTADGHSVGCASLKKPSPQTFREKIPLVYRRTAPYRRAG